MSKSKLNRRQLKKISKLAMYAVVKDQDVELADMGFCEDSGEYWHGWLSWGDWDERSCFASLDICFSNAWDHMTKDCLIENWHNPRYYAPEYYSLSFANRIHYMIKFLEASNEQGND